MSHNPRPVRSPRTRHRAGVAVATAAALLGGLAVAGPATATGMPSSPPPPDAGWTSAETVTGGSTATSDARVGVAADGTAVSVWSQSGGVWAATRAAGGAWSAAGLLGAGTAPRLGVLADGGAVAVWVAPGGSSVAGMRRAPGGGWTALTSLAVTGTTDPQPALDVAADGTAVVVLACASGGVTQVWSASLPPGSTTWSPLVAVSSGAGGVTSPSVGIGADGAGLVAWAEPVSGVTVARVAARGADGSFTAPGELGPVGGTAVSGIAVDVATDATAAAAWTTVLDGHAVVRASVRGTSGLWSAPATVSWADQESSRPDVAVAAGGVATATWLTTSYGKVMTATSGPGGGAWSDVWKLAYYGGAPSTPDAAVAPDGTPWAAWTTNTAVAGLSMRTGGDQGSTVAVASRSMPRPVNLAPPRLSSPVRVDQAVTCLSGSWDKVGPQTWWAYWWLLDGKFLDGANGRTYRPTAAQLGHRLQCKQKAGNGDVYTYAYSAPVVVAAGVAPVNVVRPVPVGPPRVGRILTCRVGAWSMRVTAVKVQWLRSGQVIRGATLTRYRLTSLDRGRYAQCRVTALRTAHRAGVAVSRAVRVR